MKLKGDKELAAEELYNSMDEELYDLMIIVNLDVTKLDITEFSNFLDNIKDRSLEAVLYYRISSVIYNLDLNVEEFRALKKLSEQRKLLIELTDIVKCNLDKCNIHNDKEFETFLRNVITGITLGINSK